MAKKTADQQKLVINQLIVRPPQRKTSDVGLWRNALQSADNGRLKQLFELYEDLSIDGTLSDAVSKRIEAVTNSELVFQNARGEEVSEIVDLMDTLDFEELITQIMHVRFWGRAGVEFDFSQGFKVTEIPKKHIDVSRGIILINDTDETGIPYSLDDNLLVLGKKRDFGLFLKTAPFAIWKRGGFGDYAQWLEIFGMPQRVGKYSSHDPESRKLLEEAMKKAGSAPWIVIPKETDVETVNNTGNGSSGTSFNDFRKACNEEILISILGQTLTTVQGEKGARSLGEVHKEVEEGKNRSDLRFVQRVLNQKVLPILEKRGFPVKGGWFVFPKAARELDVNEIVQLSDIMEIPALFLHEKFAIPMPKDGEPIARRHQQPQVVIQEPQSEPKGKEPDADKKEVKNSDRSFLLRLWDFFAYAPALTGATANHLTQLIDGDFNDRLIGRIDGKQTFDVELFQFISSDLIKALDDKPQQMADFGFVYQYQNDAFRTAQELNVFQFSAAKTIAEIRLLNQLYRESKSFEEFHQKASKEVDVFNKKWQRTEYQTATNVASSSENYHRLIAKSNLFPYWEYKTVGDDKVRKEHEKLDGIILHYRDPRWEKIWPPNGWKCRCYVIPRMKHEVEGIVNIKANQIKVDQYLQSKEWDKIDKQGFGGNKAVTAQIFTANQNYIAKFPQQAQKLLKNVNFRTFGLGSFEKNRANKTDSYEPYKGDAKSFLNNMEHEGDAILFRDFNDRKIAFFEADYLSGHADKYSERIAYFPALKNALKEPDEVWITTTKNNLNTYSFIKYYNNVSVVAIAEVKHGSVYRIRTWFPINENNNKALQLRQGLLIKKERQP
ncbi:phage head morphogenesis protein [Alkaliflexus imshenetskii]|uniref:phage head morphogenesis protein n=1 Tax=Alkaliflexus imshenetskii TaxID=286730 RepID=UPI00047A4204|nr:phage head morphogenesis protein [Alkaliflexus imshenetskii]